MSFRGASITSDVGIPQTESVYFVRGIATLVNSLAMTEGNRLRRSARNDRRKPIATVVNSLAMTNRTTVALTPSVIKGEKGLRRLFIYELRRFAVRQTLLRDHYFFHVFFGRDFVHNLRHQVFDDRTQTSRARL